MLPLASLCNIIHARNDQALLFTPSALGRTDSALFSLLLATKTEDEVCTVRRIIITRSTCKPVFCSHIFFIFSKVLYSSSITYTLPVSMAYPSAVYSDS